MNALLLCFAVVTAAEAQQQCEIGTLPNGVTQKVCRGADGRWRPAEGRIEPPKPQLRTETTKPEARQNEPTEIGLKAWNNRPPNNLIDGRSFFQAAGFDPTLFSDYVQKTLKAPVSWGEVRYYNWAYSVVGYLLPVCVTTKPQCKSPIVDYDGAFVVKQTAGKSTDIHYYYWAEGEEKRFCKYVNKNWDCKFRPNSFMYRDPSRVYLTGSKENVYHHIEGIWSNYNDGDTAGDRQTRAEKAKSEAERPKRCAVRMVCESCVGCVGGRSCGQQTVCE
jgi:hypothetical protein